MPLGGRVMIAARQETVVGGNAQNLRAGAYVCVGVTDTGTGMDEVTLKRAAEPFFTTKGVGKGTGLGLSMVYGLAAQSGGVTQILSRPGEGTTVELWLPLAEGGAVSQPRPAAPITVGSVRACCVLLVDDDTMVAEGTAAMLEHLGHRVLVATSGAAALDLIAEEPSVDLVITDHAMPGMSGMELAGRIRQAKPGIPILLATGFADLPSGEGAGLPRLDKPYRLDKLAASIAKLIGQDAAVEAVATS
jgi:CheY-like chemotaxis protein